MKKPKLSRRIKKMNNFHIENEEYVIVYKNGQHEIQLVHYEKENEVVFT